jgi:C-terminal processing protease CtpA/Prc
VVRVRQGGARVAAVRGAAVAFAALVLAGPASLRAQTPACQDCDVEAEIAARTRLERRALTRQVAELARQLDVLARRYDDEESMQRALREASEALRAANGESSDVARELVRAHKAIAGRVHLVGEDAELAKLVRQLTALETRAAFATYVQAPAGWLGVTYEGASEQKSKNGELFVHHYDYPAIISVTPWSPASKAGVRAGDTLIAYNDHDVRKGAVSLTKLLRPGETVRLRLRRNGAVRDLPVKVERREARVARAWSAPQPPSYPRTPQPEVRMAPLPPDGVLAPMAPSPPSAPEAAVFAYSFSTSTSMVAGAELTPMNADLREVFGTESGVLVLRVAAGTPASEAGLRGGDVIVRANGEPVLSTRMLSAQMRAVARERELPLEVVRKKQAKTIVLRW